MMVVWMEMMENFRLFSYSRFLNLARDVQVSLHILNYLQIFLYCRYHNIS